MSTEPISINFSSVSLPALNICLAIILFGAALYTQWSHFTQLANQKKAVAHLRILGFAFSAFVSMRPTPQIIQT